MRTVNGVEKILCLGKLKFKRLAEQRVHRLCGWPVDVLAGKRCLVAWHPRFLGCQGSEIRWRHSNAARVALVCVGIGSIVGMPFTGRLVDRYSSQTVSRVATESAWAAGQCSR